MRQQALHVSPYQMLTVASMIEREAQSARDRPLIAAVIYNRLSRGMPLAVDATIFGRTRFSPVPREASWSIAAS